MSIHAMRSERSSGDGIPPELRSLVQTYVAYLSGCDACALRSLRSAIVADGNPGRLRLLSTWRRATLRTFTPRERAALVWAEVVAVQGQGAIDPVLRQQMTESFPGDELDELTRTVVSTQGYRRLTRERLGAHGPTRHERRHGARFEEQELCELCIAS